MPGRRTGSPTVGSGPGDSGGGVLGLGGVGGLGGPGGGDGGLGDPGTTGPRPLGVGAVGVAPPGSVRPGERFGPGGSNTGAVADGSGVGTSEAGDTVGVGVASTDPDGVGPGGTGSGRSNVPPNQTAGPRPTAMIAPNRAATRRSIHTSPAPLTRAGTPPTLRRPHG